MPDLRAGTLALALGGLLLAGCGQDATTTERGLRYFPDMYQSPAYEPQEAIIVREPTADGGERIRHVPVGLTPPAGTMAVGHAPTPVIPLTDVEALSAISNPRLADAPTLRLGQERYNVFCAVCHGKDGNAAENGFVADKVNGILPINTANVAAMSDGLVFQIISHGRGRMPHYRAQLPPDERWAVVHYLRVLHAATVAEGDERQRLQRIIERGEADGFRPAPLPIPEYELQRWPAGQEGNR